MNYRALTVDELVACSITDDEAKRYIAEHVEDIVYEMEDGESYFNEGQEAVFTALKEKYLARVNKGIELAKALRQTTHDKLGQAYEKLLIELRDDLENMEISKE